MAEPRLMAQRGGERPALLGLAAVLALSLVHSWSRAFLIDDAYISFRYARNLVEGGGLVFNIGERVEGYTNFLWTLLIALASALGIEPAAAAQTGGLISSLAVLAILYRWGRDLGLGSGWALVAPAMLAVNRSYAAWATGGLETRFFTLLLVASAWRLHVEARGLKSWAREDRSGHRSVVLPVSALLLALAALTRPEGALAAAIAFVGILLSLVRRHHVATRAYLAGWLSILLLIIGGHLMWRRGYYGLWLPNSFHAKVPGLRLVSGLHYLLEFFRHHLALPLGAMGLMLVVRRGRTAARVRPALASMAAFPVPLIALYIVYTAMVGGDHFEFRFVDPILPFAYLLAAVLTCPRRRTPQEGVLPWSWRPLVHGVIVAVLVAGGGLSAVTGFTDVDRTVEVGGKEHYLSIVSTETESRYLEAWKRIGTWFEAHADPGDSIAVAPSGAIPYFSGLRSLDMLGINDYEIARLPVKEGQNVGHERWVDVEFVRSRGITYYVGSPRIGTERSHDLPGDPVEVELEGYYFYFWVLQPSGAILPGSTHTP